MKTIYYTVDVEFHSHDFELGPTGLKMVNIYTVENGKVVKMADIECDLSDSSEDKIENYLDDNGFEEEDFEFVLL